MLAVTRQKIIYLFPSRKSLISLTEMDSRAGIILRSWVIFQNSRVHNLHRRSKIIIDTVLWRLFVSVRYASFQKSFFEVVRFLYYSPARSREWQNDQTRVFMLESPVRNHSQCIPPHIVNFKCKVHGLLDFLTQKFCCSYCYVSQCQTLLLAPYRDTIWRYDVSSNDWQPIAPLLKRRFSFGKLRGITRLFILHASRTYFSPPMSAIHSSVIYSQVTM